MRKDRVYNITIFIQDSARVAHVCCSCTTGLSICCNHVTATLYCLEDFVHSGLQDDELKGVLKDYKLGTSHMGVDPRPSDEVEMVRKQWCGKQA